MTVLTLAGIDRELHSRTAELAQISAAMVDLETHPGLQHVRRYRPTGTTAKRWAAIEVLLGHMWEDRRSASTLLECARTLRRRRTRLVDEDLAEVTANLTDLTARLQRAKDTVPVIHEFASAVDELNAFVAGGIAPVLKRLDALGAAIPQELTDLLTASATDPLSLTVRDVEERIAAIADDVRRQAAELAELAEVESDWQGAISSTEALLDELRRACDRALQTRANAEQAVLISAHPLTADVEPDFRVTLAQTRDPAGLLLLRRHIEGALRQVRRDRDFAQGLLDRHRELTGRLSAYQLKAARLGLAEDPDLVSSGRIAAGLLSRQPCDLAAVTRAVAQYCATVAEKRGTSP